MLKVCILKFQKWANKLGPEVTVDIVKNPLHICCAKFCVVTFVNYICYLDKGRQYAIQK